MALNTEYQLFESSAALQGKEMETLSVRALPQAEAVGGGAGTGMKAALQSPCAELFYWGLGSEMVSQERF